MKQYVRLAGVATVILALVGALQLGWWSGGASATPSGMHFDSLTPAPFTTVAPGPVLIGAHAYADAALTTVTLSLHGSQIEQIGSQSETMLAISQQQVLSAGIYTATVVATDANGNQFQAEWDFVVSNNAGDSEWFHADGTPKATQINATMQSLVQAFRWHLYGLSWDGNAHPELPSHVGLTGTGDPVGPWVTGSTFDQAATDATLRSLVEAFRWHFWGISWDGSNHPDVPTHANTVQPPQSIDPWFTADGQPIPANITATLRSLVESFRWHFWGYSWDGSQHPDMPTHWTNPGSDTSTPTTTATTSPTTSPTTTATATSTPTSYPAEGAMLAQSTLTDIPALNSASGATGEPTPNGYKLTMPPNTFDGVFNSNWNYGDASYSVDVRTLSPTGPSAGCLMFRSVTTATDMQTFVSCLVYSGDGTIVGLQSFYLASSTSSTTPVTDQLGQFPISTSAKSTDWNTIKVISQGNNLWFFFNGTYLGTASHSGPSTGAVGVAVYNLDSNNSQNLEFTNMTVHGLQSTASTTGVASSAALSSNGVSWLPQALRLGLQGSIR